MYRDLDLFFQNKTEIRFRRLFLERGIVPLETHYFWI